MNNINQSCSFSLSPRLDLTLMFNTVHVGEVSARRMHGCCTDGVQMRIVVSSLPWSAVARLTPDHLKVLPANVRAVCAELPLSPTTKGDYAQRCLSTHTQEGEVSLTVLHHAAARTACTGRQYCTASMHPGSGRETVCRKAGRHARM